MASGTRSIVWRSDIDAGRERPAFFCAAKRSGQSPAGGVVCGTARGPANRPAYGPAFLEMDSEKGRERKREREEEEGCGEEVIC